jgi:glucokinase
LTGPPVYLGIEIGGSKLQLALGDGVGPFRQRLKLAVQPALGASGILRQLEQALPELTRNRSVHAAGVGFGGPVDWPAGRICRSHQVEGWSGFDLRAWLAERLDAPVRVDNDANVAALGEARHGAGTDFNPVFYVTLGSGVGGGLILDGRIYHGATPGEAEIGHVRLDRTGTTVESRCSGWAVDARIREACRCAPAGPLARLVRSAPGSEARHLPEALRQGDPIARQILADAAEDLAFGLSHAVQLFHPQIIILGGGLAGVGEPLRAAVAGVLPRFTMEAFAPGPRLALAALGELAVPVGAVALARAGAE